MESKNFGSKVLIKEKLGKLIDAHCHFQYFSKSELDSIINECSKNDFTYYLTNATSREDFDKTIQLSEEYEEILPGIGHHPWYLEPLLDNENWFNDFVSYTKILDDKGITYFIGEIGIDGGKPKKKVPLDKQTEIFISQLEFANEKNKLVTIHCVYDWDRLFKIFEKSKVEQLKNNKIILHSFQGNKKIMEKFNKFNVFFSLSAGCFNEKNYDMIKAIPLDRLLLESDSPSMFNKGIYENEEDYNFYFLEEGKNGVYKNHPLSISHLAKNICELREIEIDLFMRILKKNYEIVLKNILK